MHRGIECDNCGGHVLGSRMVCMTCAPASVDTLDLCNKPECLVATISLDERPDLTTPHVLGHVFYQLRKTMHARERQQYDAQAREALHRAHAIFDAYESSSGADSGDGSTEVEDHGKPTCLGCEELVTRPCWYCTECDGESMRSSRLGMFLIYI